MYLHWNVALIREQQLLKLKNENLSRVWKMQTVWHIYKQLCLKFLEPKFEPITVCKVSWTLRVKLGLGTIDQGYQAMYLAGDRPAFRVNVENQVQGWAIHPWNVFCRWLHDLYFFLFKLSLKVTFYVKLYGLQLGVDCLCDSLTAIRIVSSISDITQESKQF